MRNVQFVRECWQRPSRLNGEIANSARVETARRISLDLLHFLERNFLGHVAIAGWRLVGGRCSGHWRELGCVVMDTAGTSRPADPPPRVAGAVPRTKSETAGRGRRPSGHHRA